MIRKPFSIVLAVMFILSGALSFSAAGSESTKLSPEADEAFQKGLIAVEMKYWDQAVKFFTEAQYKAEYNTNILKNLGLAHYYAAEEAHAGGDYGHELPAIAWLSAYLEAEPEAAGAETIRSIIRNLEVKNVRSKMNEMYNAADKIGKHADKCYIAGRCPTSIGNLLIIGDIENARIYRDNEYRSRDRCNSENDRICYRAMYWDWIYGLELGSYDPGFLSAGCPTTSQQFSPIVVREIELYYFTLVDRWIEVAKELSIKDPMKEINEEIAKLKNRSSCSVAYGFKELAEPIQQAMAKIDFIRSKPKITLSKEAMEWASLIINELFHAIATGEAFRLITAVECDNCVKRFPECISESKDDNGCIKYLNVSFENFLKQSPNLLRLADEKGIYYSQDDPYTLLTAAVDKRRTDIVGLLLKYGADVNVKDKRDIYLMNGAPLHYAVGNSDRNVVEMLINHGADVNIEDIDGITPLIYATMGDKNQKEIVEILITQGADVNFKSKYGSVSPLMGAAKNGLDEIVEILITHGAKINILNNDGESPLHYAAYYGSDKAVEILLKHKADINIRNKDGKTPLSYAISNEHQSTVELLRKHGAK